RAQAAALGLEAAGRADNRERQVPAQAAAHAQHEFAQHVLLAAEIEVEGALADGRLGGNGADGGLGETLAADLALRGIEDLLARALAAPGLGRRQWLHGVGIGHAIDRLAVRPVSHRTPRRARLGEDGGTWPAFMSLLIHACRFRMGALTSFGSED